MRVALISCSKNKMTIDCSAKEMYSKSMLFKKTFDYCLNQNYDFIFILSAKHGILKPDDKISPYELTLNSFSKTDLENWAVRCFKTLQNAGQEEFHFDFYAGKIYFEELSKLLLHSTNILKGLGIGERLRFLSQ